MKLQQKLAKRKRKKPEQTQNQKVAPKAKESQMMKKTRQRKLTLKRQNQVRKRINKKLNNQRHHQHLRPPKHLTRKKSHQLQQQKLKINQWLNPVKSNLKTLNNKTC